MNVVPLPPHIPAKPFERSERILDSDLPTLEKLVAIVVARHIKRLLDSRKRFVGYSACYVGIQRIADETSLSRASVVRVLLAGERRGWLTRVHRHRAAPLLNIRWDRVVERSVSETLQSLGAPLEPL